ncbi:MAG: hypothetical protein IJ600_12650 [Lachnospiraceae bacterium]|nr:hypothetical protein [Lachnospiraceae bacterium]
MRDFLELCKKKACDKEGWRKLVLTLCLYFAVCAGISFMNAGDNYGQAVAFRRFCVAFGLMVLAAMPVKMWLTVWSGLYVPACYVFCHFAYEKHWIPDVCNYQFVDVIRLGKMVILIWGWILIAILRDMIKHGSRVKRLVKAEWRRPGKVLLLFYLAFAVLITVTNPGYFYGGFFAVGYGSLYYVLAVGYKEGRAKQFLYAFYDAVLLSLLYVTWQCLWHRPYDTERYLTYFSNSNMAGGYLACVSVVMAARLQRARGYADRRQRIAALILNYICFIWTGVLIVFNDTRTTILGLLFAYFTLFVLRLLTEKKKIAVVLRYAFAALLLLLAVYPGYLAIRYLPAYADDPVALYAEYQPERRIIKGDPVDSPKYTTITEFLRLALGKWGIMVDFGHGEGGIEEQDQTVMIDPERDVTNGRKEIWAAYLSRMSVKGHHPGHIETEDGSLIYHAHNSYFQMSYQYGLLTGIAFALLVLGAYVCSVVLYLKKSGMRRRLVFPLLMSAVYMLAMMTEWLCHPAYVICFSFMCNCGILMQLRGEKEENPNILRKGSKSR